jgi:hypothetical protein
MPGRPTSTDQATPALAALGLGEGELDALRRQGFVSREMRRGRTYFKLRFRMEPDGRQSVRYIGTDPAAADEVEQELAQLQRPRLIDRDLSKISQQIGLALKAVKADLMPHLEPAGYRFHGLAVRQMHARGECYSLPIFFYPNQG